MVMREKRTASQLADDITYYEHAMLVCGRLADRADAAGVPSSGYASSAKVYAGLLADTLAEVPSLFCPDRSAVP